MCEDTLEFLANSSNICRSFPHIHRDHLANKSLGFDHVQICPVGKGRKGEGLPSRVDSGEEPMEGGPETVDVGS